MSDTTCTSRSALAADTASRPASAATPVAAAERIGRRTRRRRPDDDLGASIAHTARVVKDGCHGARLVGETTEAAAQAIELLSMVGDMPCREVPQDIRDHTIELLEWAALSAGIACR